MRSTLLTVAIVASMVPGCTPLGALAGGTIAGVHNSRRDHAIARGEKPGPEDSVGASIVAGAAVGLVLDVAVIALASHALSQWSSEPGGTFTTFYPGGD